MMRIATLASAAMPTLAPPRRALLLTCEHAGKRIPEPYTALFASRAAQAALETHRGSDIGALPLARALAKRLQAPLLFTQVSRLLVDTNRSPHHRQLLSEYSRGLDRTGRSQLLERYYYPHRERVEHAIADAHARASQVVHIAVHSFTPILNGIQRSMDLGLLYDPAKQSERSFAVALRAKLTHSTQLRLRLNAPYRGIADGLTRTLRLRFGPECYIGIELELNQALLNTDRAPRDLVHALVAALVEQLGSQPAAGD